MYSPEFEVTGWLAAVMLTDASATQPRPLSTEVCLYKLSAGVEVFLEVGLYGQNFQHSMWINRLWLPSCSGSAKQGKCPRSRLIIWFCETGSAVPSRVSLLIPHAEAESDTEPPFHFFKITPLSILEN